MRCLAESGRAVAAAALLSLPSAAQGQATATVDAGVFNAYVWRGVTLTNRPVVQPDAYLTLPAGGGSFVLGGWASVEAGRYDDPRSHLSEGGGRASLDATEVDLWGEYGHPVGPLTGTFGGLVYLYPNTAGLTNAANRTVEIYGKLQASAVPLAPKVAVWYDVNKVQGAYVETSISHAIGSIPGFPLTLGALAGFSAGQGLNDNDPSQVANFAKNGLSHVDLSATGALKAGPVTIGPTIHFCLLHDDFTKVTGPAVSRDAKVWAGATLTWSKAFGAAVTSE
jgi:hypothetical protein